MHKVLVGKLKRKTVGEKCRHRWEDIKMDLKEMESAGVD
jgi:hypothetical protein